MKKPIGYTYCVPTQNHSERSAALRMDTILLIIHMYAIVSYAILRVGSSDVLSVQRQQRRSGAAGSVRCGSGDGLSEKFTASGGACFQFIGLMHP